jgi:Spy/CpxP family protein refolding chaperone
MRSFYIAVVRGGHRALDIIRFFEKELMMNTQQSMQSTRTVAGSRRRWVALALAAAVAGAFGAQIPAYAHEGQHCDQHHHAWHRHHGKMTPQKAEQRMERRVDHMLDRVKATDEQKQKINAITKSAFTDLQPLHKQQRDLRHKAMALLAQPTIDQAAFEQLRAQQQQLADKISKRRDQALLDASQVLTPEQRAQLAERWQKHGKGHHHKSAADNGKQAG